MSKAISKTESIEVVRITPPNVKVGVFEVEGTAPYLQLRFSEKALATMRDRQAKGSRAAKKKKEARDFDADYEAALHVSEEGWYGMPASGIRASMVRACKLAGFAMTDAKVTLFVLADGLDRADGTPLVRIQGKPERHEGAVRNATGVADIRVRAIWKKWKVRICIKYDADVFTLTDVGNILSRAAMFVGWGEGRPDSKKSAGLGYGTGKVVTQKEEK